MPPATRRLKAPLQMPDGTLRERDRGTPQGSALSPVLANLFLHYAMDSWLEREFPSVGFERYADDAVLHCSTEYQARKVRDALLRGWRACDCGCSPGRPGRTVNSHQTTLPPSVGWRYQLQTSVSASTRSSPRPLSSSSLTSRRAGGLEQPSHTNTRSRTLSDSSQKRIGIS